ncbi:hypothetical protein CEXT_27441 [Caerostris extrusa]|uniref:Uncharacterized protein n=1 Tax=Caerostris extrusa TaxID=172846 RepID=A0AAV4SVM2_CAEEX|nr:hypothetical protein CEXT_27441 [Caerostris extrusa]
MKATVNDCPEDGMRSTLFFSCTYKDLLSRKQLRTLKWFLPQRLPTKILLEVSSHAVKPLFRRTRCLG